MIKFSKNLKKTIDISLILVYNRLRCQETTDCCGSIAQLGEHLPYKQGVTGSSPVVPTTFFGPVVQLVRTLACHARGRRFEPDPGRQKYADVAHLVERHLAKVEVAGSSPVIRSSIQSTIWVLFLLSFFYLQLHILYHKAL